MICRNCGFHNEPGDEFCGSCGQYLEWDADAPSTEAVADDGVPAGRGSLAASGAVPGAASHEPQAVEASYAAEGTTTAGPATETTAYPPIGSVPAPSPPDPYAATKTIPAHLERCWNCGTANEATRTFCQSCGQQLKQSSGRRWGRGTATTRSASAGAATTPGTTAGAETGDRSRRYLVIGGVAVVAALLLVGAAVLAGFLGDKSAAPADALPTPPAAAATNAPVLPTAGAATPSIEPGLSAAPTETGVPASGPPPTAPPGEPTPTVATGGRFRCETQALTAPTTGAWEVVGARYGSRPRFDYLQFNLQRRGADAGTGGVTAELVPIDEVQARHGVAPPQNGDVALVLVFSGPIRGGQFSVNANQNVLREFRVTRNQQVTRAVVGVSGPGCFELRVPEWSEGTGGDAAVIVDIGR